MDLYRFFGEKLLSLLDGEASVMITVQGEAPLCVRQCDDTVPDAQRRLFVFLTQYYFENDQPIRDPQIAFYLSDQQGIPQAEPVLYANDRTNLAKLVYRFDYDGPPVLLDSEWKDEVQCLTTDWFNRLDRQGFFSHYAQKHKLDG